MGFRAKFSWFIVNVLLTAVMFGIMVIETVVFFIGLIPALIMNRCPKWARLPITRLIVGGIADGDEGPFVRPSILKPNYFNSKKS